MVEPMKALDEVQAEQEHVLTLEEFKEILIENFKAILEGFDNFEAVIVPATKIADKETMKVLEAEVSEFMQKFELARRKFGVNLLEIALEMDKRDGKKEGRVRMGFTSGLEEEQKKSA